MNNNINVKLSLLIIMCILFIIGAHILIIFVMLGAFVIIVFVVIISITIVIVKQEVYIWNPGDGKNLVIPLPKYIYITF